MLMFHAAACTAHELTCAVQYCGGSNRTACTKTMHRRARWLAHNPTYNSLKLAYRPACLDTQSQHRTHTHKADMLLHSIELQLRAVLVHTSQQLPTEQLHTCMQHEQRACISTPAPNACPRCCCGCCRAGRRRRS